VVRFIGARLAVPLIVILVLAGTFLDATPAVADWCEYSIDDVTCRFAGSSSRTTTVTVPPFRYLATTNHPQVGRCWFWSRYPPGLDALNPANDSAINYTRFQNPQCPTGSTTVSATTRAWEVFRSFPLRSPQPEVRPSIGIANLASLVTTQHPTPLRHVETLPDGRRLEVEAYVASVPIDWGDGTPTVPYPLGVATTGGAGHAYWFKTCPLEYRTSHPAGRNCHPVLDSYPVAVSFAWIGRYRTGGAWTELGTLHRTARFSYDVDEVIGFPVAP
jgi:hypothetical protein